MVPGAGIEPARLAAGDFESPASTDFATRACTELLHLGAVGKALYGAGLVMAISCFSGPRPVHTKPFYARRPAGW